MRVGVLGPVRVWSADGVVVSPGSAGQRAVLALLVLAGGKAVPRGELVDVLWAREPPVSAANVIQTYVKHLRRVLEPERPARAPSSVLPGVGDGYALRFGVAEVDLYRFRELVGAARGSADAAVVAGLLGRALELFAGTPLADVPVLADHPRARALAAEREAAVGGYGEALVAIGAAERAVPLLTEAAAAHPLDESAQARLIRAYHAAGRRADAFEHYHRARRLLAEELGVDPGPALAGAHAALLDADRRAPTVGAGSSIVDGQPPAIRPAAARATAGGPARVSTVDGRPLAVRGPAGGTGLGESVGLSTVDGQALAVEESAGGTGLGGLVGVSTVDGRPLAVGESAAGGTGLGGSVGVSTVDGQALAVGELAGGAGVGGSVGSSTVDGRVVGGSTVDGVRPAQLPGGVAGFTGRAAELSAVDAAVAAGVGVVLVAGTAGVGKTALAVRWGHRARERFPDGQLYVDLRGYDPERPVGAGEALGRFLRALGVPGPQVPADLEERAAGYRSLLDGRRMLVVLDNAASVEQVRPLLPGAATCFALVTSRDQLPALVARHGARRITLDLLPAGDALALFRALAGERVDAEPAAAATMIAQCARLPLALRIAAELVLAHPAATLTGLAGELADERGRLARLDAGGSDRTGVEAVFSWSYQHLAPRAAAAFRAVGLHPGADFDPPAAAALAGADPATATRLLADLARAHLVQRRGDRWQLHDLLRAYARGLAETHDPPAATGTALARLVDHYLRTAAAAIDVLYPAERTRRPRAPGPETRARSAGPAAAGPAVARAAVAEPTGPVAPVAVAGAGSAGVAPDAGAGGAAPVGRRTVGAGTAPAEAPSGAGGLVPDAGAALAWLDAERGNLRAAAEVAGPREAVRLAGTLLRYLEAGGHYAEAAALHARALAGAAEVGDRAAEARIRIDRAVILAQRARYDEAAVELERAAAICRESADVGGEARAVGNLGHIRQRQGRYAEAGELLRRAIELCRAAGDLTGEARAVGNLGHIRQRQQRYAEAGELLRRAIGLCRRTGDSVGEAYALTSLADILNRTGDHDAALDHHRQALDRFRRAGERAGAAAALAGLGAAYLRGGDITAAAQHLDAALADYRQLGDPAGEAHTLNTAGELHAAAGRTARARAHHRAALTLAREVGDRYEQARAQAALAVADPSGDPLTSEAG